MFTFGVDGDNGESATLCEAFGLRISGCGLSKKTAKLREDMIPTDPRKIDRDS